MKNNRIQKRIILQIIFLICSFSITVAQNNSTDTSIIPSVPSIIDSSQIQLSSDTIVNINDSTNLNSDTIPSGLRKSPNAVTSIVDYFAEDSVTFDLNNSIALLYNHADLNYDDINLKSDYVEIDFSKNELFARGEPDTSGTLQGKPVFKQGSYEVKSHEIHYNFDTKKGLIRNVITQEGESYLHGQTVKKNADNTSFIHKGKYTTCNLECPHFEVGFNKAKVIPNNKVVTGPIWLKVASIPIIPFPFGFFPNSDKRQNGFIPPKFAQKLDLGPGFEGFGYYFAVKDIIDFSITGTIYMRGAFGVGLASNYIKRYKFTGRYDLAYSFTPTGEKTTDEYKVTHDIKIYWQHQQDRRAHPTNNFSANIDFKTSTYSKNNIENNINNYTQSKAMSTVNFSTSFKSRYTLGINAKLSQDLVQGNLDMELPQVNFGISQFYPFRKKIVKGKLRWYENISMQYTMDFQNQISTYDSILINHFPQAFDNFRMGMNHYIPIKSTIKILKYINWENSVALRETWQIKGIKQSWGEYDTINRTYIHRDTLYGFYPAHDLVISSGLSATLYGMYTMKKGRVSAFRHTLTPSVSFSYRPGINKKTLYDTYYDSINNKEVRYSYLDGSLYSAPAYKSSGKINFAINNKLEMKVRSKKEGETFKKVTILENLTISSGYDLLADSLNWDPLRISGRTTLFKQINISFDLAFDPYVIGPNGVRINKTELKENGRLFRLSSMGGNLSFGYDINKNLFNKKDKKEKKESPSGFGDWNINLSYIFSYNMSDNANFYRYQRYVDTLVPKYTQTFNNTISINGSFALTPKWSLRVQSGYNFTQKTISVSEFYVERDLHCWIISFKWVPFGTYRSFEFGIRAKANILQDAKYNRTKQLSN